MYLWVKDNTGVSNKCKYLIDWGMIELTEFIRKLLEIPKLSRKSWIDIKITTISLHNR